MAILLAVLEEGNAAALARWATHIALAERDRLLVVFPGANVDSGEPVCIDPSDAEALGRFPPLAKAWEGIREIRCADPEDDAEAPEELWPKVELQARAGDGLVECVLGAVEEVKPELLLVGKRRNPPSGGDDLAAVARSLYARASCTAMLMRVGESDGRTCTAVLVPTGGGPHSRVALRLGFRMARHGEGKIYPLYIEPDADDVSEDVGYAMLDRIVKRCGLPTGDAPEAEHVAKRVILSDSITTGIREAAEQESFDLMIVGATHAGTIRRKLFGTVPDKVLAGDDAMAVAAVRRHRPWAATVRERAERWLDLRIPQLVREDRVALFGKLQNGSKWSFDFMVLICLSTGIAALGLVQNSTAVVIGAMLVAPLMTPLLGCGLAVVQGNFPLIRSCSKAVIYGFFAALLIGILMGFLAAPMTGLTAEMRARGGPSLLDMGVAFISGVAASYCIARPNLVSALAGVAIAAALVPPIATVGISISLGELAVAKGAALLFATNVVAIVLGAAINLYAAGIRGNSSRSAGALWVRRIFFALLACAAILTVPLGSVIVSGIIEKKTRFLQSQIPEGFEEGLAGIFSGAKIESVRRVVEDGRVVLEVEVLAADKPSGDSLEKAAAYTRERLGDSGAGLRVFTRLVDER